MTTSERQEHAATKLLCAGHCGADAGDLQRPQPHLALLGPHRASVLLPAKQAGCEPFQAERPWAGPGRWGLSRNGCVGLTTCDRCSRAPGKSPRGRTGSQLWRGGGHREDQEEAQAAPLPSTPGGQRLRRKETQGTKTQGTRPPSATRKLAPAGTLASP